VYWRKRLLSLRLGAPLREYRQTRDIVKDRAMVAAALQSSDPWRHLSFAVAAMAVEATIAGDSRAEIERRVLAAYSAAALRLDARRSYRSRIAQPWRLQ